LLVEVVVDQLLALLRAAAVVVVDLEQERDFQLHHQLHTQFKLVQVVEILLKEHHQYFPQLLQQVADTELLVQAVLAAAAALRVEQVELELLDKEIMAETQRLLHLQ